MKSMTLLLLLALVPSAFAAKPTCYTAKNPDSINIEYTGEDGAADQYDTGSEATLSLVKDEDSNIADLSVKAESGKTLAAKTFFSSGDKQPLAAEGIYKYYIECDGGTLSIVNLLDGKVLVTSLGVRAGTKKCENAALLKTGGTVFSPSACK